MFPAVLVVHPWRSLALLFQQVLSLLKVSLFWNVAWQYSTLTRVHIPTAYSPRIPLASPKSASYTHPCQRHRGFARSTAVDATHTPALYAVLLKSLISAKAEELKTDSKNVVLANGIMSRPGSPSGGMFDTAMGHLGPGNGQTGGNGAQGHFVPHDGAVPSNALWNHGPPRHFNAFGSNSHPGRAGGTGSDGGPPNVDQAGGGAYLSYQIGMLMDPTMAISVPDGGGNTFGLSGPQP